jgi:membrane peptidoglycan carboxypeptidase
LYLIAGVLLAGVLAPPALGAGVLSNEVGDSVAAIEADLAAEKPPLTTTVTDRDGHPIAVLYDQYRLPVTADGISPTMKATIIAVEDRRFYDEGASIRVACSEPWSTTPLAATPRARRRSRSST